MKKVWLMGLVLALTAMAAQAEMTLLDNGWDDYTVGTAHQQGSDGFGSFRVCAQQNSAVLGDPQYVTVVALDEDPSNLGINLQNRDSVHSGTIQTTYMCVSLADLAIYGEGTIYVRFKADGPNDTLMATNDLWPHWDYGVLETGDGGAPSFQKNAGNYNEMGAIVRLSAGEEFRAFNGAFGAYSNTAVGQEIGAWQELWVQVDHANDRVKYYLCPDGGIPTLVVNPTDGGEWWGMRNQARNNNAVMNIKFFIGMYPFPDSNIETNVLIESMAIDTGAMTTDHYAGWEPIPGMPPALQADLDGDGDVDLDDFVILKNAFGVSDAGDCDDDGDTDLDDFVILKNEFGSHS